MHYALHVTEIRELPKDPRSLCGEWQELLRPAPLKAVYFGSEFCADLLPSLVETRRFCLWAAELGLEPVLLTSIVTQTGLSAIDHLLQQVAAHPWKPAVVANDWGVMSLLGRRFPDLRCRAGRLMNRSLRDPRLVRRRDLATGGDGDDCRQEPLPASTESSSPQHARLRSLLRQFQVQALESDADLDGSYLNGPAPEFQRTLHFPFVFVATGRNCLVKAEGAPGPDACFTKGLGESCPGRCRNRHHRIVRSDTDRPLWRSGNTIFYEPDPEDAAGHLSRADRIVLYERPTA